VSEREREKWQIFKRSNNMKWNEKKTKIKTHKFLKRNRIQIYQKLNQKQAASIREKITMTRDNLKNLKKSRLSIRKKDDEEIKLKSVFWQRRNC
jgi:hypothetical protein